MMETLLRLLIVEDSPPERMLMEAAMREAGLEPLVECTYAFDGEEALTALYEAGLPFDLILLDLNLPKISGKEVLAKIKAKPLRGSTRTIIMSNSAYAEDMAECHRLGADGYFQKPHDYDHLVDFCAALRLSLESKGVASAFEMFEHEKQ